MKKITGINIDMFLNRLLYSLYNLIYFFGLPLHAATELLVQRPLYSLPCWKKRLKKEYGINTYKEYKDRTRGILYKNINHPASGFTQYYLAGLALLLLALPIYLVINIWMIWYIWDCGKAPDHCCCIRNSSFVDNRWYRILEKESLFELFCNFWKRG